MSKLIKIHPNDIVFIIGSDIIPGDGEIIDGIKIYYKKNHLAQDIRLQVREISQGERIIKNGRIPIGSSTTKYTNRCAYPSAQY